jgi:hypothetical protein
MIRYVDDTGFTGPILASITALTKLVTLYAPPTPCDLPAESGVRAGTLWRRALGDNRFSGTVPASITALTKLVTLYAPPTPCDLPAESGARAGTLWRRALGDNRFSGTVPSTISALTALMFLYAANPGRGCGACFAAHAHVAGRGRFVRFARMLHCA